MAAGDPIATFALKIGDVVPVASDNVSIPGIKTGVDNLTAQMAILASGLVTEVRDAIDALTAATTAQTVAITNQTAAVQAQTAAVEAALATQTNATNAQTAAVAATTAAITAQTAMLQAEADQIETTIDLLRGSINIGLVTDGLKSSVDTLKNAVASIGSDLGSTVNPSGLAMSIQNVRFALERLSRIDDKTSPFPVRRLVHMVQYQGPGFTALIGLDNSGRTWVFADEQASGPIKLDRHRGVWVPWTPNFSLPAM
jgi:hypothetical protein